jgi:hypothetical protein
MDPVNGFDVPPDEEERVAALHSLGILDTPPSESFDRLTSMISNALDVPIALVSFVDSERQWCKSNLGLAGDEEGDSFEAHRNDCFCSRAILPGAPDVFVVHDASTDQRFMDNALVTGPPYIRFYAGAPIKMMHEGRVYNLGTVCVMDKDPRTTFNVKNKQLLLDMAVIVSDEIELFRGWASRIMEENNRYDKSAVLDLRHRLGLCEGGGALESPLVTRVLLAHSRCCDVPTPMIGTSRARRTT